MLGKRGFRGTILYRIKVLPSHHPSPLQNQDLIDSKKNGLMEMILLYITTESRTCILHLTSLYKIKTHRCWEKRGFRGTILYRIKVLPSHHPSPLQNQDLIDPKKNGLMEMILLYITTESRTCILHLTSLYKIKTHRCWEKGVSGELFSTESRSFPLTIPHLYRTKIWRYDIDEHVFTTKSKTLQHHLIFSKISSLPKM